jgi:hypothetical protein
MASTGSLPQMPKAGGCESFCSRMFLKSASAVSFAISRKSHLSQPCCSRMRLTAGSQRFSTVHFLTREGKVLMGGVGLGLWAAYQGMQNVERGVRNGEA